MVSIEQRLEYLAWINLRVEYPYPPGSVVFITQIIDGEIVGAASFNDHRPGATIHLGIQSDKTKRFLTRNFIGRVFSYAFLQLKVPIVYALTECSDTEWTAAQVRLGGEIVATAPDWKGPGRDCHLIYYRREPILSGKYGKAILEA